MANCNSFEEILINPCVSLFRSLALDSVSNTWVDFVWDGQFTESQELPMDYGDVIKGVEVEVVLTRLQELIIKWMEVLKKKEYTLNERHGIMQQHINKKTELTLYT